MPVAAIDMLGDSRGDRSAARVIHYRAAQGPTAAAPPASSNYQTDVTHFHEESNV